MKLTQTTDIDIDPQDIAECQADDDILEFILSINEALENEDFTIQLAINLLESSDCPKEIIDQIKAHYNFEMAE